MSAAEEITQLLQLADQGDEAAANELFQLVQENLKAIAKKRKQRATPGVDLSTTELVDDAFCQLVGQEVTTWQPGDRRKFFGYVAKQIEQLLIQALRRQTAQKRGAGQPHVDVAEWEPEDRESPNNLDLMLDLQTALGRLEEFALRESQIFRIRYFLGCTFAETSEIMNLSETETRRCFDKAKLLLKKQLQDYDQEA